LKRRGLAILEGLLSILLLALVLVGAFNFLPVSLLTSERSQHRLAAQALADGILEGLRSESFEQLKPHFKVSQTLVNSTNFACSEEVFSIPGHDPRKLLGLRCVVKWCDRVGRGQVENELWVCCVSH
jgi:Tfp pilus assembly protein PilV